MTLALVASDIHLSLQRPTCREEDWLEVQKRYLLQLARMAGQLPVLIAGDLFDRWNAPPELISFAIDYLPPIIYSVAGQHDLPQHQMELIHKSGYGVLMKAQRLVHVPPGGCKIRSAGMEFVVHGFSWGQPIKPPEVQDGLVHVALAHQYVWKEGASFPGAAPEAHIRQLGRQLRGFRTAVFGDNHKGFLVCKPGVVLFNCGCFIRRKADEVNYRPQVGKLLSDGSIERVFLDTSEDKFVRPDSDAACEKGTGPNLTAFISELSSLRARHGLDFRQVVEEYIEGEHLEGELKEVLLRSIGA